MELKIELFHIPNLSQKKKSQHKTVLWGKDQSRIPLEDLRFL